MNNFPIPNQIATLGDLSFKFAMLIAIVVYGLFALVMTRQVDLMAKTLTTTHENLIRLITYIHVGLVVLFLVVVLVWL